MKNSSIMSESNTNSSASVAEISAEPEAMAKYRLGEWTTWHLAAYQDWAEEAVYNLDISLINCIDVEGGGETALHIAARKNHYRFVKAVLKFHEIDMNIVDDRSFTPLHLAVQRGNEQTVAQLLMNNKTKLNYGGYEQPCPIHIAVANDQIGCIRMLLQAGANINAVYGKQGKRAIHIAARKGDESMCRYLLSYSGDKKNPKPDLLVNGVDIVGRTALHYSQLNVKPHKNTYEKMCLYREVLLNCHEICQDRVFRGGNPLPKLDNFGTFSGKHRNFLKMIFSNLTVCTRLVVITLQFAKC